MENIPDNLENSENEGDIDMEEGSSKGQLCLHVSPARDAGHLAFPSLCSNVNLKLIFLHNTF